MTLGLPSVMTVFYVVTGNLNVCSFNYYNNRKLMMFIPDIVRNCSYFNIISSIVLLHRICWCFKNYDFVLKVCHSLLQLSVFVLIFSCFDIDNFMT